MRRSAIRALLAFGVVLGGTACKEPAPPPEQASQAGAVLQVGVSLPLTGDAAVYGKAVRNGIDLAATELAGRPPLIRLQYEDDRGLPKDSVTAVRKLLIEDVDAIIGGMMSSTAVPIAPITAAAKTPLIAPTATKPSLSDAGPYFFRLWPSDTYDGEVMAEVAASRLGLKRVAIFYIDTAYGQGITGVFEDEFERRGGEIVAVESYAQGATDFRNALTRLKQSSPEAVFLPGYIAETVQILRQAGDLELDALFLGTSGFYDRQLIEIGGEAAEGAVFTTSAYDPASDAPRVRRFVAAYRERYGAEPDAFAAEGYDALRILWTAAAASGERATDLREALHEIRDFNGVGGFQHFESNGDVKKPLRVMTVREGEFVEL